MPLYDFKCEAGHSFERFVPLADFDMAQVCACASPASRVISAPMFNVDQTFYTCPISGTPITSRRAHEDNLRRHDCIVAETGIEREISARRDEANRKFDKSVDDHVERTWDSWDGEKREALAKDIISGADIKLERKVSA